MLTSPFTNIRETSSRIASDYYLFGIFKLFVFSLIKKKLFKDLAGMVVG
jgi:hypothetical protein